MARRRKKKSGVPWLLIAIIITAVAAVAFMPPAHGKAEYVDVPQDSSSLEYVVIPGNIPNTMLAYEGFTVGFNADKHQPNFVVWTLDPQETDGENVRKNSQFQADPNVDGCATLEDYKGSGFDRGHMAPAADMKWSKKAMDDCHYLTNMCPQDNSLNSGAWKTIEDNSRKWALKYGPLVIVCGPVLSDRMSRSIGDTPVPVPERFFKVILAPQANPPMGIGFIMPNTKVEGGAQATVVSIDQVEEITGFDFFSHLPDDIEAEVESQAKLRMWNK